MILNLVVSLLLVLVLPLIVAADSGDGRMITDNSDMPNVKPTVTKGMVIDGGSGGSRVHIYTWKPRVFHSVPPPLSYPEANELWNGRIDPGIHTFANNLPGIRNHLAQLIDFVKMTLVGYEKEFADFPIYFKATGGMRELDSKTREKMITYIRSLLSDKSFCPFFFRDDFARVISGEEEAIFSWAATNFLMGTLLPNSQGLGTVENVNTTYGTLDLGGASTQIAFYVPSQDILEGLTKFQLGGQKLWNVYTRSFLQFGINSARSRHITLLVDNFIASLGNSYNPTTRYSVVNDCFHTGYSEEAYDSTGLHAVSVIGPSQATATQFDKCRNLLKPLMAKELDSFCDKTFHGDCSLVGAYQPPVPTGRHGHFIGTSSYKYPWSFLLLPKTATLQQLEDKAKKICTFNFGEINYYYVSNGLNTNNDKLGDYLPYYCFLSSYVLTLLQDGYHFNKTQTLTVMDEVNGHKVGWTLGAILFEINELPWVLQLSLVEQHPMGFVMAAGVVGFFLGVAAAVLVYREIIEDHDPNKGHNNTNNPNITHSMKQDGEMFKLSGSQASSRANSLETLQRTNTMDMIRSNSSTARLNNPHYSTKQPSTSTNNSNSNIQLQPLSRANSMMAASQGLSRGVSHSQKLPSPNVNPFNNSSNTNVQGRLPPPPFQQAMMTKDDRRSHSFAIGSNSNNNNNDNKALMTTKSARQQVSGTDGSVPYPSYNSLQPTTMSSQPPPVPPPSMHSTATEMLLETSASSKSNQFYLDSLSQSDSVSDKYPRPSPPTSDISQQTQVTHVHHHNNNMPGITPSAGDATPFISFKTPSPMPTSYQEQTAPLMLKRSSSSGSSSSSSDDDSSAQQQQARSRMNSSFKPPSRPPSRPDSRMSMVINTSNNNANNNANQSNKNNTTGYARIPNDGY